MTFRIPTLVCTVAAVLAAGPALAAGQAPATGDRELLREALRNALLAAPPAPRVGPAGRERFAAPERPPATEPRARVREADERLQPAVEALGPRPAMHAGVRLKF